MAMAADDDVDLPGADPSRVDRDRRAPRFSWTPAYEATFFRSLCESVQLGLRENSSFKAEAWERAAQALQESHGASPTKSHLINKSDNARKRFRLWRGLREDPDFVYNPETRTVTASEDAWRAHIEREPLSRALRGRPFDHEEYMDTLYPDVIGSGGAPKRIMKPRRRTEGQTDDPDMPGASVLSLQGESSPPPLPSVHSPVQQRPSLSQTPTGSSSGSASQQQQQLLPQNRLAPITGPQRPGPNVLTPPDDTTPDGKKRSFQSLAGATSSSSIATPPVPSLLSSSSEHLAPEGNPPQKRRRVSHGQPSTTNGQSGSAPLSIPDLIASEPAAEPRHTSQLNDWQPILQDVADVLKSRSEPTWREKALDILFNDFSNEDLDLQIDMAESIFNDESRAMAFCKMPVVLRRHRVQRFREGRRCLE